MTANIHRGSAEIYTFPARGRFAAGGRLNEHQPAANLASPCIAPTVFGGAWYHDEAVQEAERAPKN
jgi:hypothetical protein